MGEFQFRNPASTEYKIIPAAEACCCRKPCECPTECLEGFIARFVEEDTEIPWNIGWDDVDPYPDPTCRVNGSGQVLYEAYSYLCWNCSYGGIPCDPGDYAFWERSFTLSCEGDVWSVALSVGGQEYVKGQAASCWTTFKNKNPIPCATDGHPANGVIDEWTITGVGGCDCDKIVTLSMCPVYILIERNPLP